MQTRASHVTFLLIACAIQSIESRTLNVFAVWFKRPYKGPECVVEVIGADLDEKANQRFDMWSKPDVMVKCSHGRWDRSTQIEGNTYKPRFVWQAKMPWKKEKGFDFTVYDANVLLGNEVMGRTFVNAKRARELINSEKSAILSIGEGVGFLKINMFKTPVTLKKKIQDIKDSVQTELVEAPPSATTTPALKLPTMPTIKAAVPKIPSKTSTSAAAKK